MKKLVLMAAMAFSFCAFAQENDDKSEKLVESVQLNMLAADPSQFGVTFEGQITKDSKDLTFISVGYSGMNYDIGSDDVWGNGWYAAIGKTSFFKKGEFKGFFYSNSFVYGRVKFDDSVYVLPITSVQFKGTYSYISLFNPEFGYKFNIGDHFHIVPSIGAMWKIEIKGKGDVDNKNVDEWSSRIGVKLGWTF